MPFSRRRPLPVWRAVGRAGADPWRGKRALCPLWRGVAGADPRLLLLARPPAVAGRTQGGLGRAGAAHGPWWGDNGCGHTSRATTVSRPCRVGHLRPPLSLTTPDGAGPP